MIGLEDIRPHPAWPELDERLPPGRTMLLGQTDSGKSSLARWLVVSYV